MLRVCSLYSHVYDKSTLFRFFNLQISIKSSRSGDTALSCLFCSFRRVNSTLAALYTNVLLPHQVYISPAIIITNRKCAIYTVDFIVPATFSWYVAVLLVLEWSAVLIVLFHPGSIGRKFLYNCVCLLIYNKSRSATSSSFFIVSLNVHDSN